MNTRERALKIAQLLEKATAAVPIAGPVLSSILGVAALLLEQAKSAEDDNDAFEDLALNSADMALAIEEIMRDRWDTLDDSLRLHLDGILLFLQSISDQREKYSKIPRAKKLLRQHKYASKWRQLSSQLSEKRQLFLLISAASTSTAVSLMQSTLRVTSSQINDLQHQMTSTSTDNRLPSQEIQRDEDGLVIFGRDELVEAGTTLIDSVNTPEAVEAFPLDPTRLSTVVYAAKKGTAVYLIKEYVGFDRRKVRERFETELLLRLHSRSSFGLRLIGTIGRHGIAPSQVYSPVEGGDYVPLLQFVSEGARNAREVEVIRLLASFPATVQSWNQLCDSRHLSFIPENISHISHASNLVLARTLVQLYRSRGRQEYKLIFSGELFVDNHYSLSSNACLSEVRKRLPSDSGVAGAIGSYTFTSKDPCMFLIDEAPLSSVLSDWAPFLLEVGWFNPHRLLLRGFSLSLGQVGYLAGEDTFVVLDEVRCLLPEPDVWLKSWQPSHAIAISGESQDDVWTFKLDAQSSQVEIEWIVFWPDGTLAPCLYRYVCSRFSTFDLPSRLSPSQICIVNDITLRHTIAYKIAPSREGKCGLSGDITNVYLHALPISDGDIPELLVYLSFHSSLTAEGRRSLIERKLAGWELIDGYRLDWVNCLSYIARTEYPKYSAYSLPLALFPRSLQSTLSSHDSSESLYISERLSESHGQFWQDVIEYASLRSNWRWKPLPSHIAYLDSAECATEGGLLKFSFNFRPNPCFENTCLSMTFRERGSEGGVLVDADSILWKEGVDPMAPSVGSEIAGNARHIPAWFFYIFSLPTVQSLLKQQGIDPSIIDKSYEETQKDIYEWFRNMHVFMNNVRGVIKHGGNFGQIDYRDKSLWKPNFVMDDDEDDDTDSEDPDDETDSDDDMLTNRFEEIPDLDESDLGSLDPPIRVPYLTSHDDDLHRESSHIQDALDIERQRQLEPMNLNTYYYSGQELEENPWAN